MPRDGGVHGQLDIQDGELSVHCFLLCFFHGQDEVRHAHCILVEEEHVQVQHYNVKGMETCRVLLKEFKAVMRKYLVEEHGAILEFVDVHLLHHGADELFAAILSCLSNSVVFGVSFVDGFGLLYLHDSFVFGNLVIPEAKVLGVGKCGTIVVGHVGQLCLNNPYNMMKPISPL